MLNAKNFNTATDIRLIDQLKCGDIVELEGYLITGRDAAHKRIFDLAASDKPLPIDLKDQIIYYTGPCPSPPGHIVGSCGPTTSARMDYYTPMLLELGLKGMIGKGPRSEYVIKSIIKHKAVYFAATGGAGALIASCVKSCTDIAFEDLGAEAMFRFYVVKMPLIVAIDSNGGNIFNRNRFP